MDNLFPDDGVEISSSFVTSAVQIERKICLFFKREGKLNQFLAAALPGSVVEHESEKYVLRSHCVFERWRKTPQGRRKIWAVELTIARYA